MRSVPVPVESGPTKGPPHQWKLESVLDLILYRKILKHSVDLQVPVNAWDGRAVQLFANQSRNDLWPPLLVVPNTKYLSILCGTSSGTPAPHLTLPFPILFSSAYMYMTRNDEYPQRSTSASFLSRGYRLQWSSSFRPRWPKRFGNERPVFPLAAPRGILYRRFKDKCVTASSGAHGSQPWPRTRRSRDSSRNGTQRIRLCPISSTWAPDCAQVSPEWSGQVWHLTEAGIVSRASVATQYLLTA